MRPVQQVTRYWRAPEVLLGSSTYSTLIDVWAAGVLLMDMLCGRRTMRAHHKTQGSGGEAIVEQLTQIASVLGWPAFDPRRPSGGFSKSMARQTQSQVLAEWSKYLSSLDGRVGIPAWVEKNVSAPPVGLAALQDLLTRMLAVDPGHRISATKALEHEFFLLTPVDLVMQH